ncbi:MAG: hypothetical protein Kow0067_09770 [Coriobacteriia bacterium]
MPPVYRRPDGRESTVAWYLWIVVGVAFAFVLENVVLFALALAGIVVPESSVGAVVGGSVAGALVAFVVARLAFNAAERVRAPGAFTVAIVVTLSVRLMLALAVVANGGAAGGIWTAGTTAVAVALALALPMMRRGQGR